MRGARGLAALAVVLAFVGGPRAARAQPQHVDIGEQLGAPGEPPLVILLTFGEGVQIFEKFGHGALCLYYPSEQLPQLNPNAETQFAPIAARAGLPVGALVTTTCFNYGVTNFREGAGMVWNFLRGKQKFWVDTERMIDMVAFYSGKTDLGHQLQEDRDVWMQRLPLTPAQARRIEAKLLFDIKEENKFYIYDHFFDNCTTRLRDMIDDATDHKFGEGTDKLYGPTFRELGYRGIAEYPLLVGAADFYAGRQLDDHPTVWLAMFHPDIIRAQVEAKLGVKPALLYARTGPPFPQTGSSGHLEYFLIALGFALPLLLARLLGWGRVATTAAVSFATLYLFLWGAILWGASIVSSIPGLRWNELVFVLMPVDIVLPILSETKRRSYARGRLALLMLVSLLDVIGLFHQPVWIPVLTAFMPMALLAFWPARTFAAAPTVPVTPEPVAPPLAPIAVPVEPVAVAREPIDEPVAQVEPATEPEPA